MMEVSALSNSLKRKPSDDLSDQRLAKRFDSLNIENTKYGSFLSSDLRPSVGLGTTANHGDNVSDKDHMEVEDTRHKVYIYDLDKELEEEIQSDEHKPIFIPDIEKHMNHIPKVFLIGDDTRETAKNMQLVLYDLPASLTVAKDKDSVRKAIIESRRRLQDKQGLTVPDVLDSSLRDHQARDLGSPEADLMSLRRPTMPQREPAALQVPMLAQGHLLPKATIDGPTFSNDPDVMDMD